MTRKRKLFLNTISSILRQVVFIISGFVLPRLILAHYGSAVNGLVNSITQFMGFITLAECGVGTVVQAAFYKPLAENDSELISKIFLSSERFFKKIGLILGIYTIVLSAVYPFIAKNEFDWLYTTILIVAIAISIFSQYFLGMTYRLLLNADQLNFIQLFLNTAGIVISTVLSIILIKTGCSIQTVKLSASIVTVAQPFVLRAYVQKHYNINRKIIISEDPLKQKWNGLAQHIASTVLTNTDVVVLTVFSTLENVSVYSVYHLVVSGVQSFIQSATSGFQSLFGNMIAKGEREKLSIVFSSFQCLIHSLTVLLFSVTGLLIVPFVRVYTAGVSDANYIVPVFGVLITCAQAIYNFRLPYNLLVLGAGHFKQTQASAIIEACINIVISIVLVWFLGLIGVAIGTIVAMTYRTIYLSLYVYKTILLDSKRDLFKNIIIDVVTCSLMVGSCSLLIFDVSTYGEWIVLALMVFAICLIESIVINVLFNRKELKSMIELVRNRRKRI